MSQGQGQGPSQGQDWITICRRKRGPASSVESVEQKDPDNLPKPRIASESLLALIRKRMEMKLNQEMADLLCHFPRYTFKGVESRRIFPTSFQIAQIEKYFHIPLKMDVSLSSSEEL